ncbi:MAG: Lrp/AsnC family transcriptional regulator [Clostridia bacterium]|nr:Lrp/AsnC family transcriptional regulator [Clostridia bacterium]
MDEIDVKLLHLLSEDAGRTSTELVPDLNLSIPAINKRIARMKASGQISRVTILTEPNLVGKPLIAYVMLVLRRFSQKKELLDYVESDIDVLECYAITGEYDFILKICARDIDALESKLLYLKNSCGVSKSNTLLTLMRHKFTPSPLPDKKA